MLSNRLVSGLALLLASGLGLTSPQTAEATILVTGPAPGSAVNNLFFGLDIPPGGATDERGFSGFEYLISGVDPIVDPFFANDMYLIGGNVTDPSEAIGIDLGDRNALSGVAMNFSIKQNLLGGRNLTFSMTDPTSMTTNSLCWGLNCGPSSVNQAVINGMTPTEMYNGLQIQIRAQDVARATASVQLTALNGVNTTFVGSALYNETVDPSLAGTIQIPFNNDAGRRGQWLMADNLEFLTNEWELTGLVTLSRPDNAVFDRSKVRLAIDLVRDPNLPFVIPEPSTALLVGFGLTALAVRRQA